jgi:ribose transport system substrate-binding protein
MARKLSLRKLLALALPAPMAALAGLGAASAGASSAADHIRPLASVKGDTLALVNGDNADPFFFSIWEGALYEAKKYGIKIVEQAPTTFDYTQQEPLLTDELAKHVNGIIFSPDSNTAFADDYKTAKSAGIPVVDVNDLESLEHNNPDVLAFLGTNNLLLGQSAAQAMEKLVGPKALVTVINSVAGSLGDYQRGSGYIDFIHSHYMGLKILKMQFDLDDRTTAQSIATDEIDANPTLKGIYGVDSFTGQGVGAAVKALHDQGKIKVVAIDAEPQEVTLMRQGVIQALIAQQPYKMGVTAVQDIVDELTGDGSMVVRSDILPPIAVTPQNVNTSYVKTSVVYATTEP